MLVGARRGATNATALVLCVLRRTASTSAGDGNAALAGEDRELASSLECHRACLIAVACTQPLSAESRATSWTWT